MENNPLYTDFSREELYRPEFDPSLNTYYYNSLNDSIKNIKMQNYNLFQGKTGNQYDILRNTGNVLTDNAFPEFFSPTKENYQRFTQSPDFPMLGFVPGADNEDVYGKFQSTGEKIANGFSQMWDIAGYQFVDQLKGWGRMFDFNPIGEDLEEVNKNLDEIMNQNPIFMSIEDRESTFNWSKFSNIIGQTGFTLGMAGEILFEELVLTIANAATLGALTPVQSARTASLMAKVASTFSRTTGKALIDATKVADRVLDVNTARNVFQRMTSKVAQFTPMTNSLQLVKGMRQGENALQFTGRGFGAFYRDLREANAVFTEARAEASGTEAEVKQELYDNFVEKYNRKPNASEQANFEKIAKEAAYSNFISNSIIIGASNRIMFDNLFRGFKGVNKFIGESGDLLQDSKGFFAKGFNIRTAKAALKTAPLTYFKNNLTEAVQENLQSASNAAIKDWYNDNYFNPESASVTESIKKGLKSQVSQEGLDTFLAGFLTGSIAGPIQGGAMWAINRASTTKEQRQLRKQNLDNRVSQLNEYFTFNDKRNLPKQMHLANMMYDAVRNGNNKQFQDYKDEAFRSFVRTGIETNKIDALFSELESSVKNLTDEEFKNAYNAQDKKDVLSAISDMKKKAERIKSIKEELDYKLPTDYSNLGIGNSKSYEEAKWHIAFMQDTVKRASERIGSLRNEIASIPEIGKIPFSEFELLYNPDLLEEKIKTLKDQNKLVPEKEISRKIKILETLKERGLSPALFKAFIDINTKEKVSIQALSESFDRIVDITLLSEDERKVINDLDFLSNPSRLRDFVKQHQEVQQELAEEEIVTPEEKRTRSSVRVKRDIKEIPEVEEVNGQPVRKRKIDESLKRIYSEVYNKKLSEKEKLEAIKNITKEIFGDDIYNEEGERRFNKEEKKYEAERIGFFTNRSRQIEKIKGLIERAKEYGKKQTAADEEELKQVETAAEDPEIQQLIDEYLDQIAINRLEDKPELGSIEVAAQAVFEDLPNYELEIVEVEIKPEAEETQAATEEAEEKLSTPEKVEEKPIVTTEETTPASISDIEAQKADIERRRKEELETTKNIGEDKLKEGRENTKRLVESLKQRYSATSVQGIIIRILEKLIDFGKYSTVVDSEYLNSRNASGQATWFGMIVSQETFDGILAGKEFEVHTFIHEFIHGLTTSKISDYNIEKKGLIPGFKSKLTTKEKNAIEQLQRIFEKVKKDNPKSKEYGFTNLDEFIAEAFSNSSFQYGLKNIKAEGKKSNLFSEFINAIGDLLFEQLERWAKRFNKEIPERSTITGILEDVLAWTEEIIDQNNKLAYIATNEEINAKYDAELTALEQKDTEETTKPVINEEVQEPVDTTREEIKETEEVSPQPEKGEVEISTSTYVRKIDQIPLDNVSVIPLTTITNEINIPLGDEKDDPSKLTILNLKKTGFKVNQEGIPDENGTVIEGLPIEDYSYFSSRFVKLMYANNMIDNFKFFIQADNDSIYEHYKDKSYTGPKFEKGTYNYDGVRKGLVILMSNTDGSPIYVDRNMKLTTPDKGSLIYFFLPADYRSDVMKQKRQLIFDALAGKEKLELNLINVETGGYEKYNIEDVKDSSYKLLNDLKLLDSVNIQYIIPVKTPVPVITLPEVGKVTLYMNKVTSGINYDGETLDILSLDGQRINYEDFPEYVQKKGTAKEGFVKDMLKNRIRASLMALVSREVIIQDDIIMFKSNDFDKWDINFEKKYISEKYPFDIYHFKDGKIQKTPVSYKRFLLENSKMRIIPLTGPKAKVVSLYDTRLNLELRFDKAPRPKLPRETFDKVVEYLENQKVIIEKICK